MIIKGLQVLKDKGITYTCNINHMWIKETSKLDQAKVTH